MRTPYLLSTCLLLGVLAPIPTRAEAPLIESETTAVENTIDLSKIAPLKEVVLFPNQARLQRVWALSLRAGRQKVTLEGLEHGLVGETIQVLARTPGVTVELVEAEQAHQRDILSAKAAELRVMIDQEEAAIRKLTDDLTILGASDRILKGLEIGRLPVGTPDQWQPTPLNPTSWNDLLLEISAKETQLHKDLRGLEDSLKERQIEMQVLLDRIQRLQAYEVMARKNLNVTLSAESNGPVQLELSYQVRGPGWFPHYQTRVNKEARQLELAAYAVVFQGTGQDWNDVALRVSTANPDAGANIPDLQTWYLREDMNPYIGFFAAGEVEFLKKNSPRKSLENRLGTLRDEDMSESLMSLKRAQLEELARGGGSGFNASVNSEELDRRARVRAEGHYAGGRADKRSIAESLDIMNGQFRDNAAIYEQLRQQLKHLQAQQVIPQTRRPDYYEGTSIVLPLSPGSWYDQEFTVVAPGSVPSTSQPVRVLIGHHNLGADFYYLTRPREQARAFLMAEAKNDTGISWLAGGLRIFFGDDFVGRSHFPGLGEAGTFELPLGNDENLKIKRTIRQFEEDKGVFSSERRLTVDVTLEVKNLHPVPASIRLEERLPTTTHKDAHVELVDDGAKVLNQLTRDLKVKDLLRWTLNLGAGETQTFTWRYTITHDNTIKLEGFQP